MSLNDQSLLLELRNLFPTEYKTARQTIQLINQNWASLPDGEAVPLTYHFVNAQRKLAASEIRPPRWP